MRERSKGECLAQLGCAAGASFEEAKKAYRALAMKCHPDRDPSKAAEDRFKKISTAFESLRTRHQDGRWDAKEAPQGAEPAPAAVRRWRGPEHWNVPIEGPFTFVYLPGGSVAEIAKAFYGSWAAAAERAAWGRGGEKAPQSLAMAHLKLFARYAPGLTDEDLPTLASEFARAFWAREAPGSLAVAEKAFARAREEVNDNAWAVVDPINPRIAWRAPAGREPAFSMLDQIAAKRASSEGSIRFHQEVAKRFEGLAPIERLDDKGGRKARAWALRLALARPELFGIYERAGWFDWSCPRYQEEGFARGLIDSAVGWGEKAAPLWRVLGPRGCALALQAMEPEAARAAVQAWQADFIREGAVDEVAPELQTKAMRKASPLRRAHREVKAATAPALGRWGLALRRKVGREREPGARAFAAVCAQDAPALREALAQSKAQGEQSAPRVQGTPLAVFAAWSQAFEGSDFAGQAFEALRDFFGEQAMREVGPGSRSGADWEAARAPRRRPA